MELSGQLQLRPADRVLRVLRVLSSALIPVPVPVTEQLLMPDTKLGTCQLLPSPSQPLLVDRVRRGDEEKESEKRSKVA